MIAGNGGSGRGTGYRVDETNKDDWLFGDVVDKEFLTGSTDPVSLLQWRVGELFQGNAQTCVIHGIARGIDVTYRYRGVNDPPFMSRRLGYFGALRQEIREAIARGEVPTPIQDRGCYPRLAMRSIQKIGFCDEGFWEYNDFKVLETPPPIIYQNAIDQKGFEYSRIISWERQRAIDNGDAMRAGKAPIIGIRFDAGFSNNQGETITSIDRNGILGAHMISPLALEYDDKGDLVIACETWWRNHGDSRGLVRIREDVFGSEFFTDNYVIKAAPTFSTVAS